MSTVEQKYVYSFCTVSELNLNDFFQIEGNPRLFRLESLSDDDDLCMVTELRTLEEFSSGSFSLHEISLPKDKRVKRICVNQSTGVSVNQSTGVSNERLVQAIAKLELMSIGILKIDYKFLKDQLKSESEREDFACFFCSSPPPGLMFQPSEEGIIEQPIWICHSCFDREYNRDWRFA